MIRPKATVSSFGVSMTVEVCLIRESDTAGELLIGVDLVLQPRGKGEPLLFIFLYEHLLDLDFVRFESQVSVKDRMDQIGAVPHLLRELPDGF